MLSINDAPEIRETFKAFQIESVATTYSMARAARGRGEYVELIIRN